MSFLRPCGSKRQSRADWLALEALFEQVAIAPVLSIIVIDITASNALNSLSHCLFTFTDEKVKMVRHQTIGIERTIGATSKTIVIILIAHPIERIDKLVIVFCFFEYVLVVNPTHHHVEYPRA